MRNIRQIKAMQLNRHARRALASINKCGKIPARQNVKISFWSYLKFWDLFR